MSTKTVLLGLHVLAILLGVAYFVLAVTVGHTPDANIGAGLAVLWLSVLGLPWSVPLFTADVTDVAFAAAAAGTALLNLALHLVVRRLLARRRVS